MKTSTRIKAILAIALLGISAAIVQADSGQTRLKTRLAGAAIAGKTPEGSAEFRTQSGKNRSQLNVEVEHVNLPAGTMLDVVLIHGTTSTMIGQIKLSAVGESELELNSQDGATVPAVQKGDMVSVSNAGSPILAGAF